MYSIENDYWVEMEMVMENGKNTYKKDGIKIGVGGFVEW